MCIAIVKKPNGSISQDRLRSCFSVNSHGAGFAYVKNGIVRISKGHMSFEDFWKAYDMAFKENPTSTFLIHFRIATSGDRGPENTHPFHIPDGGALIHNGILFYPTDNTKRSDTNIFAAVLGKHLKSKKDWVDKKTSIEEMIGVGNKLCTLWKDNSFVIINEMQGNWENNVWYSNTYGYGSRSQSQWTGVSSLNRNALAVATYHGSRSIN